MRSIGARCGAISVAPHRAAAWPTARSRRTRCEWRSAGEIGGVEPGSVLRIRSPFDARIRYSAWSALRILPAHQRRHLWLAERELVS